MEDTNCEALIQSGDRKGERCMLIATTNGYCIHHQRQYQYELLINEGKELCGMFFRGCDNELSEDDINNKYKNCESCRIKKSRKLYNCALEGCTFKIKNKEDKYCGKHIRQLIRDDEKENNIKYCDIDRGCFNKIISGSKCEECKNIEKEKVSKEINNLRQKHNIIIDKISNKLDKKQEDNTICVAELWRGLQKNAYSRSLLFTLTENDFEKLIIKPCYYCGFVSNTRLNGIDRMNNNKGYILSNCISCCKMCNIIKNMQHPNEFLDKVDIINNYVLNNISIKTEYIKKWDGYLSKANRETYKDYKLHCDRRKLSFFLTEKEYDKLVNGKCYLCGIEKLSNHTNGIDRFDSTIRSYTLENSRSCCGHCNLMKGMLSYSDFIMKCIQINKYNCDRTIFNYIPAYSNMKCRNEIYSSDDIYEMMTNGKYMNYIEWCKEKDKSPEFISAMNIICNSDEINNKTNKDIIINNIKKEMEKERSRHSQNEMLSDTKNIQCTTVYCYLTQGKTEYFKEWYNSNYKKSTMFDEKLKELITNLPSLNRDDGIETCKKFMYDEKNRRNIQQRREKDKKVKKYSLKPIVKTTNKSCKNIIKTELVKNEVIENKLDSNEIRNEIIIPTIDTPNEIVNKVVAIQTNTVAKSDPPKQWKVKDIYEYIKNNNENIYKEYCEANNDITKIINWNTKWVTFVLEVKNKKSQEESESIISEFVEDLRRIRHNQLCYEKNSKLVEKEDRQQWPNTTVARAFLEGKIDTFKKFTEEYSGDNPDDPKWVKRWNSFLETLDKNREDIEQLKKECTKFMIAQRAKKFRRSKQNENSSEKSD